MVNWRGPRLDSTWTLVAALLAMMPLQVLGLCIFYFDSRVSTSGNFSSPGWPGPYPGGLRCTYVFQAQMFHAVTITFHAFHLEEPYVAGCVADYMDVTSVDMAGVRQFVGRYCGGEVVSPLLTLHPRLELLLTTNLALHAQGFSAHYVFLHEETVKPSAQVMGGREVCGGLVEGPGGSLISPGFPQGFPAGLSCTWLLRARPHYHVYLYVHQLQLQGSIANCRRAELAIHDGYQPQGNLQERLKSFCGDLHYYRNQADKVVLSQWNRLLVTFRTGEPSDNTTKFAGFHLFWTEVLLTTQANCSSHRGFWCPRSVYCVGISRDGGCITTANFCIHPSLVCDGQPNCSEGDQSDETECQDMVIIATAATAGTCGVMVSVVGIAILWVKWKRRRRTPLASSCTAQTLVTTPSSTAFSNSLQGPDLGADVAWMESSVPTPPPPPFLSSPPLPYPLAPIPSPQPHIPSPLLSMMPLDLSLPTPSSNPSPVVSPLLPSPPQSSWPLLSPPPTPTPTPPPPPLSETRDSKWPKSLIGSSSGSPQNKIRDSKRINYYSSQKDSAVSCVSAVDALELPALVSDSGSSGSHLSSQPSTVHSTSIASTLLDVGKLNLSESLVHKHNEHITALDYRPHYASHTHCSHCPYFTQPVIQCHHNRRSCGLVRSNSLPKHHSSTGTDQSGPDTIHVNRPWPLTPKNRRRGSCIGDCDNEQGRESPEGGMCFPCVSAPSRVAMKSTPVIFHHHHGKMNLPASHWCPHMMHHCSPHGHCCHGNHAIICSSFSEITGNKV
ncbi:uncharacterized protein LOC121871061 [Homarus americanus]|uniref:uncharacterized protein LOC121871061 n=1 Tax=Homarus americanus TaxID=6706 RepID=UPI001C45DFFB|nr:uncharacterized protein LOC121871061 [Homarus americanus]